MLFDNFTFAYTNARGSPFTGGGGTSTRLVEIVDNFNLTPAGGVPEPVTWTLTIMGFGAVGGAMRTRRRSTTVAFAA